MTSFELGDRVRVQAMVEDSDPGWIPGVVSAVNESRSGRLWYEVDAGDGRELWAVPERMERFDGEPARELNSLITDVNAKGLEVKFTRHARGTWCEVGAEDPEEYDTYFGHGEGLSPLLALEAALVNGGAW